MLFEFLRREFSLELASTHSNYGYICENYVLLRQIFSRLRSMSDVGSIFFPLLTTVLILITVVLTLKYQWTQTLGMTTRFRKSYPSITPGCFFCPFGSWVRKSEQSKSEIWTIKMSDHGEPEGRI
jgi:hypothetical protein